MENVISKEQQEQVIIKELAKTYNEAISPVNIGARLKKNLLPGLKGYVQDNLNEAKSNIVKLYQGQANELTQTELHYIFYLTCMTAVKQRVQSFRDENVLNEFVFKVKDKYFKVQELRATGEISVEETIKPQHAFVTYHTLQNKKC